MKRVKILAAKFTAGIASLCMVLILPMCTSMPAVSSAYAGNVEISNKSEFNDMNKDHWAFQSVNRLTQLGILSGYPDGSFQPGRTVTYGEYIKMAVSADSDDSIYFVNCGPANNASGELNSDKVHWAEEYYETALSKNYFSKNRITKNMLHYPISRRDMALISGSVIGKITIENYSEIQASIKDIDFRSQDEYEIVKAYATGILKGYPDGTFKPDRTLTRAEAAISIERLITVLESKQGNAVYTSEKEGRIEGPTEFPGDLKIKGYPLFVYNNSVPIPGDRKLVKPISELISGDLNGTLLEKVKYYWINENSPYRFKIWDNLVGTQRLLFSISDKSRQVILIDENKYIAAFDTRGYIYGVQGLTPGSRLPEFDYIGVFTYGKDTMMLIKNPIQSILY